MASIGSKFLPLCILTLALCSNCTRPPRLQPFTSDGCSLFPNRDKQRGDYWCECCFVHDYAYWKGGPEAERKAADSSLGACVYKRTGDSVLARLIYKGTRAGGASFSPTWYRWGYGWPYRMKPISDSARKSEIGRQSRSGADLAALEKKICAEDTAVAAQGRSDSLKRGP